MKTTRPDPDRQARAARVLKYCEARGITCRLVGDVWVFEGPGVHYEAKAIADVELKHITPVQSNRAARWD